MTAPTDQFVDIAKRSQEAVTTAVRPGPTRSRASPAT